ncbi:MAG TPA: FKBP-type peptidyl-prolyl cis-trans isomerase [Povalibacter sp.]|uniref:FKBP-type peptidyl-prolyl cis-trans isomerase n=1 Tax=Povalibacter sp. TaxID=1962978 RepID=UPI002C86AAF6|nr:FKBP-type peptidyl-prolyl cis-trans isomerase [Povalibacter sp.]HMN46967.1 FKBP-type peptidyl-prolyl cis-trans isomerase [Povalibacter sp.]
MLRSIPLLLAVALLAACSPKAPPAPSASATPAITELVKTDVVVGTGEPIAQYQVAVVHYTGWLYDPAAAEQKGAKFDSSRDRGTPFRFAVGAGSVIKGWDEGVAGMSVGGRRLLIVPAELGYGDRGAGRVIPPGATLLFDVELLAIEPAQVKSR